MSADNHTNSPGNEHPETENDTRHTLASTVEEGVECTKAYARHAVDVTKDAACRATETAREMYHTVSHKAEDGLECSKDFVRRNPVTVVLGAVVFGAAVGYLLLNSRRRPTLGERFVDAPVGSVREALLSAIAPVRRRMHDGYDHAREGVEKAMERVHRYDPRSAADSLTDRLGRVGNNFKFW